MPDSNETIRTTITQQMLEQTIGAIRDAGEAQATNAATTKENTEITRRSMEATYKVGEDIVGELKELKGQVEIGQKETNLRMEALETQMKAANERSKTWGDRLWATLKGIPTFMVKYWPLLVGGGGLLAGGSLGGWQMIKHDDNKDDQVEEGQMVEEGQDHLIDEAVEKALDEREKKENEPEPEDQD